MDNRVTITHRSFDDRKSSGRSRARRTLGGAEYRIFSLTNRSAARAAPYARLGYTLRDYGSRVGIFRIMEVLDKFGIRASVP